MKIIDRRRLARKTHYCTCGRVINAHDVYLERVVLDEPMFGPSPYRLRICATCATAWGMDEALMPLPIDQVLAQELV